MQLKILTSFSLTIVSIMSLAPSLLADTITTVETSSVERPSQVVTTTVQQSAPRQSNYLKRLARIMEQIEQGNNKNWLTPEQVTDLRNQHKALVDKEATFYTNGKGVISKADGDCLEKEINGLNISVTRLMNSGMATSSGNQL